MDKVVILTEAQKDSLINNTYDGVQYFNPVQDINNNWVVSEEEINCCSNDPSFNWIKSLTLTDFQPKPLVDPFA